MGRQTQSTRHLIHIGPLWHTMYAGARLCIRSQGSVYDCRLNFILTLLSSYKNISKLRV